MVESTGGCLNYCIHCYFFANLDNLIFWYVNFSGWSNFPGGVYGPRFGIQLVRGNRLDNENENWENGVGKNIGASVTKNKNESVWATLVSQSILR